MPTKLSYLNALTNEEARGAYRVGVARALAELGLTPSMAETALAKCASIGVPAFEQLLSPIEAIGTTALVAGGAAGALTGHLRHSIENTVADQDDPQTEELKKKVMGYQRMTRELQTARAAGLTQ